MTSKRRFTEKVESFCKRVHEHEYGLVTPRAEELCGELRSCSEKIGRSDFSKWEGKLDRVSGAYHACEQGAGTQWMCNPFVDAASRLSEACRHL